MKRIKFTFSALGPISHGDMGAGDTGNVVPFRRISVALPGGVLGIPALSSGSIRGIVRRLLGREAFDATGLSRETYPGSDGGWDRLYAALCNGGTIEASESRVNPDAIRARREALPVLSLLGAALYGSHMDGLAQVSNAWLDCAERGTGTLSLYELLGEETRVRHIDREEQDPEISGVKPMPTTTETVITGAVFRGHASFRGRDTTCLEASAFAHGLDLITHVGGKSGQGFGEVEVHHDGDGSAYVAWLHEHRDAVREALIQLGEELTPGKGAPKVKAAKPGKVKAEPEAPALF